MKILIRFLLLLCVSLANSQANAYVARYDEQAALLKLQGLPTPISVTTESHVFLSDPSPLNTDESTYSVFTAENQSSEDDDDNTTSKVLKPSVEALFIYSRIVSSYQTSVARRGFLPSLPCSFTSSPRYIVFRSIRI